MQILFAATLFVSAALLFAVQPMFAKMVLPLLGGAPNVWNTCMVFYQAALLAGYLYAHLSLRWLGPRRQALLHFGLLLLPWLVLPIGVARSWAPPVHSNPVPWLLVLLSASVGLPFFVVSASAPMLQAWFAETGHRHAKDPYFLYAASNLGSVLALLSYPLIIEPSLGLKRQAWVWAAGFGLLTFLTVACALSLGLSRRKLARQPGPGAAEFPQADPAGGGPTLARRLRWLALSFAPSSLLLGVTTHISTDIAAVPLLWIIPFVLYLLSFVLVFARRPLLPHRWLLRVQPFFALSLAVWFFLYEPRINWLILPLHLATFFVMALVCHGELAATRPSARHLTEFYLWMSVGGVLGGFFNAVLAPQLFTSVVEYPLVFLAACMLRPSTAAAAPSSRARWLDVVAPLALATALAWGISATRWWCGCYTLTIAQGGVLLGVGALVALGFAARPLRFGLGVAAVLLAAQMAMPDTGDLLHAERSFFGVVRVKHDLPNKQHLLIHGSTCHGMQSCDPESRRVPMSYYHPKGPLGQVFESLAGARRPGEIGVVGLGAGTIAAYGERGQQITYYEIDPAIVRVAQDPAYFSYLADCPADLQIVLGDARLTLAAAPAGRYDLLVLDAYSSDAIPLHLVTREALQLYLDKLAEDGILAMHISSSYFNPQFVLARLADDAGLVARVQLDPVPEEVRKVEGRCTSRWLIMARRVEALGKLIDDVRWRKIDLRPETPLWTDDFSNILSALLP